MRLSIVIVGLLAACGSTDTAGTSACKRIGSLCGAAFDDSDVRECSEDWTKVRKAVGAESADKFAACTREANSCGEALGCAVGVLGKLGQDFERGFEKMMGDKPGGSLFAANEPLPAECKRADDVCAPDEPFARDKCRDMVGNLKSDPATLGELTSCYARANNCYELEKCTTNMWFKLH